MGSAQVVPHNSAGDDRKREIFVVVVLVVSVLCLLLGGRGGGGRGRDLLALSRGRISEKKLWTLSLSLSLHRRSLSLRPPSPQRVKD